MVATPGTLLWSRQALGFYLELVDPGPRRHVPPMGTAMSDPPAALAP
jgi:hypothetical protein